MLHSVSYAGLWGQAFLPVDAFVDKAAELGYEGVMLMAKRPHASMLDYSAQLPAVQAVPIEEGFIDYRGFFRSLCAGGFTGSVAYELCSPLRDGSDLKTLDRYARLFVEFLKQVRNDIQSMDLAGK